MLMISALVVATIFLFYTVPRAAFGLVQRWRRKGAGQGAGGAGGAACGPAAGGKTDAERAAKAEAGGAGGAPRVLAPVRTTVRPPLPLARGLSARYGGWAARRPRLARAATMAALAVTCSGSGTLQLINMAIPLVIPLIQSLFLGHRIPRLLWPAAALMIGGAAMILVPSLAEVCVKMGGSASLGSSNPGLGIALSVLAMVLTSCLFVLLQYCALGGGLIFLLPLSLGIDGTDWSEMAAWTAADWTVLAVLGSAVCSGAGFLIQYSTWALSAPTVSMFFGMRLVFTIAMGKAILGTTVIQTGPQIAGVVVTVATVTAYMGFGWWQYHKGQQAKAGAGAGAGAEGEYGDDKEPPSPHSPGKASAEDEKGDCDDLERGDAP
eukprot:scaffold1.g5266.t1